MSLTVYVIGKNMTVLTNELMIDYVMLEGTGSVFIVFLLIAILVVKELSTVMLDNRGEWSQRALTALVVPLLMAFTSIIGSMMVLLFR